MRQIYPPTITGKGSFAEGGSVLEHRFGQSDAYTLGVEEEYMLLDGETFDLVQHIDTVLAAISGHELETQINAELMQSVLEIATPVSRRAGRSSSPPSPARGRRLASATTPTTRRWSASSRRRAASPTTRTSGGTSASIPASGRSRCASWTRSHGSRTRRRSRPTSRLSSSCTRSATSR